MPLHFSFLSVGIRKYGGSHVSLCTSTYFDSCFPAFLCFLRTVSAILNCFQILDLKLVSQHQQTLFSFSSLSSFLLRQLPSGAFVQIYAATCKKPKMQKAFFRGLSILGYYSGATWRLPGGGPVSYPSRCKRHILSLEKHIDS